MVLKKKFQILSAIFSLVLVFSGCGSGSTASVDTNNKNAQVASASNNKDNSTSANGQLKIHYIDVGQGDSILIQQGSQNMLIDTGTNDSTNTLMSYLQKQGIKKIDYLVLTHPHEDHIGGADAVIKGFDIGTVYMPKITTTTKTFKDVVAAMQQKNLKATEPQPGSTFKLGEANCEFQGPISSNKEDLNTYSIVLKLTFGSNKFLFTGDAQTSNEQAMASEGYDMTADVLKVGHHGSHTSTSQAFLDKVNPKYAVISCGKGNDYGHPHKEVIQRLQAKNIPVYRTDECGTVICTSDGKNITFDVKPGDYKYGSEEKAASSSSSNSSNASTSSNVSQSKPAEVTPSTTDKSRTVYWTPGGKSYHYDKNCKTLKKSKTILSGPLSKCPKSDPCDICAH